MNVVVVIAAGGRATRLGTREPKSLLNCGVRYYLEMVLRSVASYPEVIVATNRAEFREVYAALGNVRSGISVVEDAGVVSTLELARDAAAYSKCSHILFCYGHAPRPAAHIKNLARQTAPIVVSTIERTSKRDPIAWSDRRFIEPPYLIERETLVRSAADSWRAFFEEHRDAIAAVALDGPCEFNYAAELIEYERYVEEWTTDQWPTSLPTMPLTLAPVAHG